MFMEEQEMRLIIDDLNRVGGYAQAKLLLSRLPKDVQDALRSTSRAKHVIEIKTKIIILLKDRFDLSFPAIAELLGYSDHSGVIHHYHKVKRASIKNKTL